MKKKKWAVLTVVLGALCILFLPIPSGTYKDGGTREYRALTYKVVSWKRLLGDSIYEKTRIYLIPDCYRSVDNLWDRYEKSEAEHSFRGTVAELSDEYVLVKPEKDSWIGSDMISFDRSGLGELDVQVGSVVKVTFIGEVMETFPARINPVRWMLDSDHRPEKFNDSWISPEEAQPAAGALCEDVIIREIYEDCFFAVPLRAEPYVIKINGKLPEEWCPMDPVRVTYKNETINKCRDKAEADFVTIEPGKLQTGEDLAYKPVIYLYPRQKTEVSVNLTLDGKLTCTYPAYDGGWKVTAMPDGTLTDARGQSYNYLYWEGTTGAEYDFSEGFCIPGADTAAFLEESLARLGLTRREANEFIIYWLPLMENNPYNIISFQQECYTDSAKLKIDPVPDTLIRVFMAWKPAQNYQEMKEQTLTAPQRQGFTAVEWGGTMVQNAR